MQIFYQKKILFYKKKDELKNNSMKDMTLMARVAVTFTADAPAVRLLGKEDYDSNRADQVFRPAFVVVLFILLYRHKINYCKANF
jgi:hypothetical protein